MRFSNDIAVRASNATRAAGNAAAAVRGITPAARLLAAAARASTALTSTVLASTVLASSILTSTARASIVLASTALASTIAISPVLAAPPIAQIRPVQDNYGPATLIDHYRWMETSPNPELQSYLQQYTASTTALLARLPERDRIAADIAALAGATTRVELIAPDGDTLFYLKRGPRDDVAHLLVRAAAGGKETLLVDPEALPDAKPHSRITAIAPSPDGKYVAYTLQSGGPETAELRVHDVTARRELSEHLPNAAYANVSWRPDSTGFLYTRPPLPDDDVPVAQPNAHLAVFLHRLGTKPGRDLPVLQADRLPFAFKGAPNVFPRIQIPFGSDYALAILSDGVSPEIAIYTAPVGELALQPAPWRPIAVQGDGVSQIAVAGSIAFLLSSKGAPQMKVLTRDLADTDPGAARVALPAGTGVITCIAAAADALYVSRREGASAHLLRLDYNDSTPEEVRLPFEGDIAPPIGRPGALAAEPRERGAYFGVETWTHPASWQRYDAHLRRALDLELEPAYPRDLSGYQSIDVTATGRDGARIPLSIITRDTTRPDHPHPAVIEAYGAFGYSYYPRFMPEFLPFLDRGGVLAVAHIRGGGELGEPWHQAGRLANRPNVVNDLLASGEALIKLGYTDPAHLAVSGAGAGVLAVAGAITKDPGLFRAAILRGGLPNPLRAGHVADAELNAIEFGNPADPAQLPFLLEMDPYLNVRDGVEYPAVLITGTADDPRAPAWQQAKMAARLQAASTSGRPVLLSVAPDRVLSTAALAAAQADETVFLLWQLGGAAPAPAQTVATAPSVKRARRHPGGASP